MRKNLYLATVASDAVKLAKEYNLGLELDQYCMAENMVENFPQTNTKVKEAIAEAGSPSLIFHAPFNELHPAAIDPEIKNIAFKRYERAFEIARAYRTDKMIVHSGYLPHVYYKVWHHERSIEFWKAYMEDKPKDFIICIENVLDDEPYMMRKIAEGVNLPNVRLCLDVGHANIMSKVPTKEWLDVMEPYLEHVHIHNNEGEHDQHGPIHEGQVDMRAVLDHIGNRHTITIESLDAASSLDWMDEEGYLE